jgi:hypothetical protein
LKPPRFPAKNDPTGPFCPKKRAVALVMGQIFVILVTPFSISSIFRKPLSAPKPASFAKAIVGSF